VAIAYDEKSALFQCIPDTSFQVPCSFVGAVPPVGAPLEPVVDAPVAAGGLVDAAVVPVALDSPPQLAMLKASSTQTEAM